MIWKRIKQLLSLLRKEGDRFLVVEIYENNNRAGYIRANWQQKELKVLKTREHPDLKKLLKKFGRLNKYKIVVGLDSHLASTIYSSVVLVRDRYKELIDEPELDNLISQAIWKFFDRSRNKVAGKIGVADLDVLLTDVRIRGIKLDSHKVVNPVGFKAKTVEVQFSQTFLSRGLIDSLKEILPLNQVVLVSESGTAWASVVAKASPTGENFLLANIFSGKTQIFLSEGSQNSYWDRFGWGEDSLKQSLSADLAVDKNTAGRLVAKYLKNETSETFRRRFEHLLAKELDALAELLAAASKKVDSRLVYVNPFFELPPVFASGFRNRFSRSVTLRHPTLDLIAQNFGFDIKFKNSADSRSNFGLVALLMEWYLSPQDDKMSQLAKRRVRWLSPI